MRSIAVICDTGTNTPQDFIDAHDIRVVPLRINFANGDTFESGVTIDSETLVSRLATEVPKTSLPSPEAISDAFKQAQADGYKAAVFVSISSGLSATFDTVSLVAQQFKDFPIAVIDSKSIGVAAGMVVMEAVRAIKAGVPFSMLNEVLEDIVRKTHVFFAVDSLEYLHKGGRINDAIYRIGQVLNIKPIITCASDGRYKLAQKARGFQRALETEIKLVTQEAQKLNHVRLAISSFHNESLAQELERELRERISNVVEVVQSSVSPDLLVHTGPSLVGIAVTEAPRP